LAGAAIVAGAVMAAAVAVTVLPDREPAMPETVGPTPTPSAPTSPSPDPTTDPDVSVVAVAKVPRVEVYRSRVADEPFVTLDHPTSIGGPLVFLVKGQTPERVRVLLPIRPNGSSGWIPTRSVKLRSHSFKIEVRLAAKRITVFEGDDVFLRAPVGIGTRDTPTPGGTYYIKELLKAPDPNTVYGTYAYGLSGFSNRLTSFAGGDAVIGLHGTNDPSTIGQTVSHGCIRMYNRDIEKLVPILPLGTPVEIRR
jgi:lipoprotein-anchoring transpeptidase ErfK/SrfK